MSNVVNMCGAPRARQTWSQVLELLRDGQARTFTTENLTGYFYKAPRPEDPEQTRIDGAVSAITYWDKATHEPASPTLMLYDFLDDGDDPEWIVEPAECHPRRRP